MILNNKVQKSSRLVKNVYRKIDMLGFATEDPGVFNDYDLIIKHSVLVPVEHFYLFVEIEDFDFNRKVDFTLRGFTIKEALEDILDTTLTPNSFSVGELTLYKNTIINYEELLRITDYINNPKIDFGHLNLGDIDELCIIALRRYLFNRIFKVGKKIYNDGRLNLNL